MQGRAEITMHLENRPAWLTNYILATFMHAVTGIHIHTASYTHNIMCTFLCDDLNIL